MSASLLCILVSDWILNVHFHLMKVLAKVTSNSKTLQVCLVCS